MSNQPNQLSRIADGVERGERFPRWVDSVTRDVVTYDPDGPAGRLCPCDPWTLPRVTVETLDASLRAALRSKR